MIRFSSLLLAAVLAFAATALAATQNITQTAQSGQVKATYTYTVATSTGLPAYSNQHLTIVRNGTTAYSQAVIDKSCSGCGPARPGTNGHSVQVVDINHTGEPNVILSLYTGGAHCCSIAQVFTYAPAAKAYTRLVHNFADPGYTLKALGPAGAYRFLSADGRFAYEFTDFASSGMPIQIWSAAGKFVDVTRSYPSLIATDAARWLKAFSSTKTNGGGLLAAWAADEELLGKDALVQSTLQSELKAGRLNGNLVANGQKYINLLDSFLKKLHYKK